nr:tail fiber protein [uncultured Enterobacter sp.]
MNCSLTSPLTLTACALALLSASPNVLACSVDPYVGAVCFMATSFCPRGYVEANGQQMAVQQSQALYSLISRVYTPSSTGNTAFNLPDLRGRSPVGMGVEANGTVLTQGQMRGAETAVMDLSNMPPHSHQAAPGTAAFSLSATSNAGTSTGPATATNQLAAASGPATKIYAPAGGTQIPLAGVNGALTGATVAVSNTGQAVPFATLTPQTPLRACVAVMGIYPRRP